MIPESWYASTASVKKTLTHKLADGSVEESDVYIRELTSEELRGQLLAEASSDETRKRQALARLISVALTDADGNPALTLAQACKLKPSISAKLRDLIMEVNGGAGDSKGGEGNGVPAD